MAAVTLPFILSELKNRKRRGLLASVEKTEGLRHERFKLEGEAHRLLALIERELPDAYRGPDAAKSPASPDGMTLTEKAKTALKRRSEIVRRIEAIDQEINRLLKEKSSSADHVT